MEKISFEIGFEHGQRRMDEGNAFQIVGAWYEKDLCPWDLVLTLGITRSFSELDFKASN